MPKNYFMTKDEKVLHEFYKIITENKIEKYEYIASERTKHITIVMENIQKNHNASAVLRTCDCFGIQNLHAIEKSVNYEIQRDIALGAGNWVDLHSHSEGEPPTVECLKKLKSEGYRIIATSPHTNTSIQDLDITKPIALVFGTEKRGISTEVKEMADELVKIPMYGFTESFNISVSAAIALNILRSKLQQSDIDWKLSDNEQTLLKIKWCTKILRDGEKIEKEIRARLIESE
jgi:tRNA (guanosine-2'-O-)-methyltransferase